MKLRALAKLCIKEFFDYPSLSVVAERRILEVLELAMPPVVEKKVRGKKKQQQKKKIDPRKLEILDACRALGRACGFVGDVDDARRYFKRAKEGYEEQLGRDSEKALHATYSLISITCSTINEVIEKLGDLVKRMERALGREGRGVLRESLEGNERKLGKNHPETFKTMIHIAVIYDKQGGLGKLRSI